jgi:Helix-turn-helix domain
MAYIPDESIDRLNELSKGARHLYVFLARCRNQKSGRCFPSVMTTQEALGINRGSVFSLRKELSSKGWATFDGNEVVNLLGFASLENQTPSVEKTVDKPSLKNQTVEESDKSDCTKNQTTFVESISVDDSLKNRTDDAESDYSDSIVRKIRLNSLNNQTAYKEEPAKEPAKRKARQVAVVPTAIAFIRQLTHRYPDKTLWNRIIKTLGENFDQEKLTQCYENWVSHGWNKMNLVWIFDWYVKGIPQNQNARNSQNGMGHEQVSPPIVSASAEWLRRGTK